MATAICKKCGHRQSYQAQRGPKLVSISCDGCGKCALRRYLNRDWEADLEAKYGAARRRREQLVVEQAAHLEGVNAAQVETFADERPPVLVAASAKKRRAPQAVARLKKKLDQVSRSLVALQTALINSNGDAQQRQAEALEALAAFGKLHAEQSAKLGAAVLAKLDAIETVLVHQLAEVQGASDDQETAPTFRSPLDVLRQHAAHKGGAAGKARAAELGALAAMRDMAEEEPRAGDTLEWVDGSTDTVQEVDGERELVAFEHKNPNGTRHTATLPLDSWRASVRDAARVLRPDRFPRRCSVCGSPDHLALSLAGAAAHSRAIRETGNVLAAGAAEELPPVEDNPADQVKRRDPYLDPWVGLRIGTDACSFEVLGVVSHAMTVRKTYENGSGDELAMTREQWETLRRAPGARVLDAADEEVQHD